MKKLDGLLAFVVLAAPAMLAQDHYTEGPVWRIQLIRVKPTQMDAYLSSLRQSTKPFLEEEEAGGQPKSLPGERPYRYTFASS
jgi:hypothetical protein